MPQSTNDRCTRQRFHRVSTWILAPLFTVNLAVAADSATPQTMPLSPPATTAIPQGPLGDAIRYGQNLVTDTQTNAKAYVGNGLNCASCHLDGGRTANAAPLVGLTGMFPEYRTRTSSVETLEERINDCFERSMNGKPLPDGSKEMVGLLAYIAWLSQGVPVGTPVEGRGFLDIQSPEPANATRGKAIYGTKCAACHGATGQGQQAIPGTYVFPPLWGEASFNTGAGMSRIAIAAAFVQAKMPLGNAGTLSDQEAFDVAAYFTAQPRPVYSGTEGH